MDDSFRSLDRHGKASSSPAASQGRSAPAAAREDARSAPAALPSRPADAPVQHLSAPPQAKPSITQDSPPENLTFAPIPSLGSDPTIEVDWEPVAVGSNRSFGCTVTSAGDHDLTVSVQQSSYRRLLQGAGFVKITALPVASSGTEGVLTARDLATGAAATFTWRWHARTTADRMSMVSAPTGFWRRLLRGTQGAAARAVAPAKDRLGTAGARSVAERLGARAALAAALNFFGQEAIGQRFAFVLDMSGSMRGRRWEACVREFERTLTAMPEHVEFFVVLFSTMLVEPQGQSGWERAERARVQYTVSWIRGTRPAGGTQPLGAFQRVFSLPDAPDIVYFLTDGALEAFAPSDCAELRGPRPTIINTISLESRASVEALETIASESGGRYIHVPAPADR